MSLGALQNEGDLQRWLQDRLPGLVRPLLAKVAKIAGIDFGTDNLSFTASTQSAGTTINHGLGVVPAAIVIGSKEASFGQIPRYTVKSATTTQFVVWGEILTSSTVTSAFYWLAVV